MRPSFFQFAKSATKAVKAAKAVKVPKVPKVPRILPADHPFHTKKTLSPALASFLNERELSRPQAVKAVWTYIKAHNLQNPDNKREIICDSAMRPLFGDRINMFEMVKVLFNNIEKN